MDRVAVFVDAGYLFAAASAALTGSSKQPRHLLTIDAPAAMAALVEFASDRTRLDLLRVYWYDGMTAKGQTSEHQRIAACDYAKLRLGFINASGEQKGVDSLIVTDMVELARNGAMADAVLVAGDEDTRIGMQIAQSFGVRVHLLGIAPARSNQSRALLHEADTCNEWTKVDVSRFLTVSPGISTVTTAYAAASPVQITPQTVVIPAAAGGAVPVSVDQCVSEFVTALAEQDIAVILEHWREYTQLPKVFDGRLLASTRDRLGRQLVGTERRDMREGFIDAVRARHAAQRL